MQNEIYGQIYAIIDPFPEQLGGRVQYIGKHKLYKNETNLQESLEKYLMIKMRGAKNKNTQARSYNTKQNVYLRSEIKDCLGNLYERPKIEQVEVCYSEKELNNREEHWRLFFLGFYPNLLNMMPGGQGGPTTTGRNLSVEHKNKISETIIKNGSCAGENHPMFGKNPEDFMTPETIVEKRRKQSVSGKIAQNKPEVKKQKIIATTGENNPMFGKKHSDEAKEKMSNAKKGKPWAKDRKANHYGHKRYMNETILNWS